MSLCFLVPFRYRGVRVAIHQRIGSSVVCHGVFPSPVSHIVYPRLSRLTYTFRLLCVYLVYGCVFPTVRLSLPTKTNNVQCGTWGYEVPLLRGPTMSAIFSKEALSRSAVGFTR